MSPIGKIFVVVNLALSAAFLGWASNVVATSQEWKTKHDELEASATAEKEALEADLAKARTELAAVRQDKEQIADARDDEKTRADNAENERDQLATENSQLRNDLTKISSALDDYNDKLESVASQASKANDARLAAERERNDAVQEREDARRELRDAQDATLAAQARVDELGMQLASARNEVASLEALRDTIVAVHNIDLSQIAVQPDIDGAVISVKSDPAPGLVAINRGSNDGVLRGTTFEIFSGRTYKGQVRVEFVHPEWCSAVIVRSASGTMSQGDSAATNL